MELSEIRDIVQAAVRDLGLPVTEPLWETVLVADGSLRGYRFEFDNLRAFWFKQSRTVELYTADWRQLEVIDLGQRTIAEAA